MYIKLRARMNIEELAKDIVNAEEWKKYIKSLIYNIKYNKVTYFEDDDNVYEVSTQVDGIYPEKSRVYIIVTNNLFSEMGKIKEIVEEHIEVIEEFLTHRLAVPNQPCIWEDGKFNVKADKVKPVTIRNIDWDNVVIT